MFLAELGLTLRFSHSLSTPLPQPLTQKPKGHDRIPGPGHPHAHTPVSDEMNEWIVRGSGEKQM